MKQRTENATEKESRRDEKEMKRERQPFQPDIITDEITESDGSARLSNCVLALSYTCCFYNTTYVLYDTDAIRSLASSAIKQYPTCTLIYTVFIIYILPSTILILPSTHNTTIIASPQNVINCGAGNIHNNTLHIFLSSANPF